MGTACPFCDPQVLAAQAFYEDDLVLALLDRNPAFPGHCLIIPRRHVERFDELTEQEAQHVFSAIRITHRAVSAVFGTRAYLLLEKNGREVAQDIPHVHMHYIPRRAGETSLLPLIWNVTTHDLWGRLTPQQMAEQTTQLKSYLQKHGIHSANNEPHRVAGSF